MMMPRVSSAAGKWRSTATIVAPSRAKATAVALPLPQPGPLEPAPKTIAILLTSLPGKLQLLLSNRSEILVFVGDWLFFNLFLLDIVFPVCANRFEEIVDRIAR